MSMNRSRESTSTKMKGAGDGLKTFVRTPVPSSRKFTATPIRGNQNIQLSLRKEIDKLESKQGIRQKAKSVAEITPTKTKGPRPRHPDAAVVLHATPRPPADEVSETPSRRPNEERHYEELGFRRWLVFARRRGNARWSESLRRRQDQVLKLEKQVDCLKDLNQSECDKRNEAINERQRVESILKSLREANDNLHNEEQILQSEIIRLQNALQKYDIDMENMKNDINSKNTYLKQLETEIQMERQLIKNLQDEQISAANKIKAQDIAIKLQDEANERMNQTINNLENAKQVLTSEVNRLTEQYGQEIKKRKDTQSELENLKVVKEEMTSKIGDLEEKLATMTNNCFTLSTQLKEKLYWWDNIKDFVIISWAVLQQAAYLMLPAIPEF